jgi:hypothetical protein
VVAALDIDGEFAVAWYFEWRVGELSTGGEGRGEGGFDVVDEPIRADDGSFGLVHWRSDADSPGARERGGSRVAERGFRGSELDAGRRGVSCARGVDIGCDDFEVV